MLNNQNNVYDFWGAPKKSTETTNQSLSSTSNSGFNLNSNSSLGQEQSFNRPSQSSMFSTLRCTCGGMGSPTCPVHGNKGNQSPNLGAPPQQPNPTPAYNTMTTREVLDDQFKRGGFFKEEYEQDEAQKQRLAQQQAQASGYINLGQEQRDLIQQRQNDYQNKFSGNSAWIGVNNMNADDWKNWAGNSAQLMAEKTADAYTLGGYALLNKKLGGNYDERNKKYHQEAQDAGIGNLARINDLIIDFSLGAKGPGTLVAKAFANPATKASSYIASDIVNSGIANANRSGKPFDQERFAEGGQNAASMQLLEYLRRMGLL